MTVLTPAGADFWPSATVIVAAVGAAPFNASGRRRGTFVDCLVAACAIDADAALATANPDDFARMPGVRVA